MISINIETPYIQPPRLPLWEWVEQNIVLSLRQPVARGSYGYYRTDMVPYARGIFDALEDPSLTRVTVVKGAQLGLTLLGYCWVCYCISQDPDPVLIVMPNADIARSKSQQNMMPLIEDSPTVAAQLTTDPDDFKKSEYILRRCAVNWIGANSPANLASRASRYLLLDETEKYPVNVKDEAGAVWLALERAKTFEDFMKVLETSTPVAEHGHISQSYLEGDRRQYNVPCARCGKPFVIDFKRDFKFNTKVKSKRVDEIARDAFIECPSCNKKLNDDDKERMVDDGKWVAEAKTIDPKHATFKLPSWYAKWVTIAQVVQNFLQSKDDPSRLQNFVNSTCGDWWREPPKKEISLAAIRDRQTKHVYAQGVVPTSDDCVLLGTTDIQQSHLVFHVYALTLRAHYLIDNGYLAVIDDIDEQLMQRSYIDDAGRELFVTKVLLDTGYDTMKAYEYALRHPYIMPIKGEKGSKTRQTKPVAPSRIESFPNGKLFGGKRSLTLFHIHPHFFKDQLSSAINSSGEVGIFFHKGIDSEFMKQMTGEVLKETKPDKYGKTELYWEVVRRPQDDFDCGQYSFAARHLAQNTLMKLDRMTTKRRELDLQEKAGNDTPSTEETPEAQAAGIGIMDDLSVDPESVSLT